MVPPSTPAPACSHTLRHSAAALLKNRGAARECATARLRCSEQNQLFFRFGRLVLLARFTACNHAARLGKCPSFQHPRQQPCRRCYPAQCEAAVSPGAAVVATDPAVASRAFPKPRRGRVPRPVRSASVVCVRTQTDAMLPASMLACAHSCGDHFRWASMCNVTTSLRLCRHSAWCRSTRVRGTVLGGGAALPVARMVERRFDPTLASFCS